MSKPKKKPDDTGEAKSERRYVLGDQIGYLLRLASQRHAVIFQENMLSRLTPTQFSALVKLAEVEACSQNHLGRLTAMDVATIKGVIDRLRARDLVVVAADDNDRRRTSISLSNKGRALIDGVLSIGHEISEQTLAPLSPNERKTLLKLLRKITG